MLDAADGGRRGQRRPGDRRFRRDRRRSQGPADDAGADRRHGLSGLGYRSRIPSCRARKAARFRWWIAASNRSGVVRMRARHWRCSAVGAAALAAATRLDDSAQCNHAERARSAPAIDRRSDRRELSAKTGRAKTHWTSSDPKIAAVDAKGLVTAGRRRRSHHHRRAPTAQRVHVKVRVKGAQPRSPGASESRHPGDDQDGLQPGRVPRSAGRQERLQAHPARLRSGCRLRYSDPAIRWAGAFRWPSPPPA